MRLKTKKKIATMMFTQPFTGKSNIMDRTTITIGITIIIAIPRYILGDTGLPSTSPDLKSPANIRITSPNRKHNITATHINESIIFTSSIFLSHPHNYHYISLFMPFINVGMSLDHLFQWIAPIYGRF